jgi:ribosome-associated protein
MPAKVVEAKVVEAKVVEAVEPPVDVAAPEPGWPEAVAAAEEKQAKDIKVLDLREVTTFCDFFVICNGTNTRQNQAISDSIEISLKHLGRYPSSIEGYDNADWILLDYGDFLVHVFTEKARAYYDLERLWREAKVVASA